MSAITVYQCDADGWFAGQTVAHESPLEPGVFHLPAGCVETEPPFTTAPAIPRWVAGEWVVQVPSVRSALSPAELLAAFLAANPSVAAMIGGDPSTANDAARRDPTMEKST